MPPHVPSPFNRPRRRSIFGASACTFTLEGENVFFLAAFPSCGASARALMFWRSPSKRSALGASVPFSKQQASSTVLIFWAVGNDHSGGDLNGQRTCFAQARGQQKTRNKPLPLQFGPAYWGGHQSEVENRGRKSTRKVHLKNLKKVVWERNKKRKPETPR